MTIMMIIITISASSRIISSQYYHGTNPVSGLAILYEFEEIRICFTGYMAIDRLPADVVRYRPSKLKCGLTFQP